MPTKLYDYDYINYFWSARGNPASSHTCNGDTANRREDERGPAASLRLEHSTDTATTRSYEPGPSYKDDGFAW